MICWYRSDIDSVTFLSILKHFSQCVADVAAVVLALFLAARGTWLWPVVIVDCLDALAQLATDLTWAWSYQRLVFYAGPAGPCCTISMTMRLIRVFSMIDPRIPQGRDSEVIIAFPIAADSVFNVRLSSISFCLPSMIDSSYLVELQLLPKCLRRIS
jgi:hypothetical protein